MQGRRGFLRRVGAAAVAGVAGCGRAVRPNDVPGGVKFVNQRSNRQAVTLRAFRLADQTPDDTEPTPVEREPAAAGQFRIPPETTATNDSFFPAAGTYLVAASNLGTTVRERIKLFETIGGGLGADTVVVRLPEIGDVRMTVTDVD